MEKLKVSEMIEEQLKNAQAEIDDLQIALENPLSYFLIRSSLVSLFTFVNSPLFHICKDIADIVQSNNIQSPDTFLKYIDSVKLGECSCLSGVQDEIHKQIELLRNIVIKNS